MNALMAFAENDPSEDHAYPNPHVQMILDLLNPMPYAMAVGRWSSNHLQSNPVLLVCLAGFTLGMIIMLGILTGRTMKEYQLPLIWIQFPGESKFFSRFGLKSLDPEWRIEEDSSNPRQAMYVSKADSTKRYPIPGSIGFSALPPPPPPPPPPGDKKSD